MLLNFSALPTGQTPLKFCHTAINGFPRFDDREVEGGGICLSSISMRESTYSFWGYDRIFEDCEGF